MKKVIFLINIIFSLSFNAQGLELRAYEDDQVVQLIRSHSLDGVVWLDAGKKTFLALYQEPPIANSLQAAIILHSMGMHADWPGVVTSMRKQIPKAGWATLSVQLPLLDPQIGYAEYGNTFKEANNRVRASIRYLQDRGYTDIVVIGYSFGATSAINYLVTYDSVIKALVGISMQPHLFLKPKYDLIQKISDIKIPILDVFGSKDFSGVIRSSDDRRLAAIKGGNSAYNQVIISSANHYFTGRENDLMYAIINWLNTIVAENSNQ